MRIHLLEHDPFDMSRTNMTRWAKKKGHSLTQTYVCNGEKLPSIDAFDWLMVMGGSPSPWEEEQNPWLPGEKAFIAQVLASGKMIFGICFGAQLLAEAGKSHWTEKREDIVTAKGKGEMHTYVIQV